MTQDKQTTQTLDPSASGGTAPGVTKRLTRSDTDRYLGGVCGGLAAYSGVDANLIRVAVVLGTILGAGSLIILYAVAWLLLPED